MFRIFRIVTDPHFLIHPVGAGIRIGRVAYFYRPSVRKIRQLCCCGIPTEKPDRRAASSRYRRPALLHVLHICLFDAEQISIQLRRPYSKSPPPETHSLTSTIHSTWKYSFPAAISDSICAFSRPTDENFCSGLRNCRRDTLAFFPYTSSFIP